MWVQRRRFGWVCGGLGLAKAAIEVVQKEVGGRVPRASLDLG